MLQSSNTNVIKYFTKLNCDNYVHSGFSEQIKFSQWYFFPKKKLN